MSNNQTIKMFYRNWKGTERTREVVPLSIRFGQTDWHRNEQWLIAVTDIENGQENEFALKDCCFLYPDGKGKPVTLMGGYQLTPDQCKEALDRAMEIIESVGTTGIHEKCQAAHEWMSRYYRPYV